MDDATVSSSFSLDPVSQVADEEETGGIGGLMEEMDVEQFFVRPISRISGAERGMPAVERGSSRILEGKVKQVSVRRDKMEPTFVSLEPEELESVLEYESEAETNPEEEEEVEEPRVPSYICPSSVSKSHNAEVKMWLKNSCFSGAIRAVPFFT